MALTQLRRMLRFFPVKPCQIRNDLLALHAKMCTFRQFNPACLNRNSLCELPTHNDNSFSCYLPRIYLSTGSVHFKSVMPKEIISAAMKDVDLEELQEKMQKERLMTSDNNTNIIDKVKEVMSKKCDEILANLGPEDEKKLKVIKLEHSFLFSEGYRIPNSEEMLSQHWLEALKLPSKSQRLKYYTYITKRKFMKEAQKQKQAAKKEQTEDDVGKATLYEHGFLFLRIYDSAMKRWLMHRLAASMMFGLPLVIDMDYASHMRTKELNNTASQLQDVYTLNRADEGSPFHLHFTSCDQDNPIYKLFQVLQQNDQGFLATVSEKSYLDLFDKETLIYLSPHARQVMREFDPEAVYIIGALNDKAVMQPLSYARAKEQKIKCMRLPLDEYLDWNMGSKNLTLDQMMKILMAVKNKKSWLEAFKAIPKRKLKRPEDQ